MGEVHWCWAEVWASVRPASSSWPAGLSAAAALVLVAQAVTAVVAAASVAAAEVLPDEVANYL